jgi:hypothetical protein
MDDPPTIRAPGLSDACELNFNFIRDIAPVGSIERVSPVMVVNPSFPAKTVAEFIAYAKANPGKINMASSGNGNITHMYGEMFKMMAGVEMVHVPYRGVALAVRDLLAGQVQVGFAGTISSIEYIRAGWWWHTKVGRPNILNCRGRRPRRGRRYFRRSLVFSKAYLQMASFARFRHGLFGPKLSLAWIISLYRRAPLGFQSCRAFRGRREAWCLVGRPRVRTRQAAYLEASLGRKIAHDDRICGYPGR